MKHAKATLLLLSLLCAILPQSVLLGEPNDKKALSPLFLKEYRSQTSYPTQGDEALDITRGGRVYRLRVLHPQVVDGPHFSTALFWVGKDGDEPTSGIGGMVSSLTRAEGLSWHSLDQAIFFSETQGSAQADGKGEHGLSGVLAIDGWDNADWGAGGLLYLYDGARCTLWKWTYTREPEEAKGTYQIVALQDATKPLPAEWQKRLNPVLERAEVAADYWPGP